MHSTSVLHLHFTTDMKTQRQNGRYCGVLFACAETALADGGGFILRYPKELLFPDGAKNAIFWGCLY